MAKNKKLSASANGATKNSIDGRAIAASAIEEMHDVHDDAKAFVEECRTRGRDPQEVAAFIAAREGMTLGAEEPQKEDRKRLYHLLKEVIRESVKTSVFDVGALYSQPSISKMKVQIPCYTETYGCPCHDPTRPKVDVGGGCGVSISSVAGNVTCAEI